MDYFPETRPTARTFKNKTPGSDKLNMRVSFVPSFFVICVCLGFWVAEHSWNGDVYVYVGEQRSPATVRDLAEFSSINREALYRSPAEQLMHYAHIYKDEGLLGVQLGHPLVPVEQGKAFGCQVQDLSGVFDRMQLVIVGTGVSSSGEMPKLVVDSKCRSENDLNQLESVWIPMQQIMNSVPKDQDFEFPGESITRLSLQNIPDAWPENWVLWEVRFYREDNEGEPLVIDAKKMREAAPALLSFDWKPEK